jgi:hypothetical protein
VNKDELQSLSIIPPRQHRNHHHFRAADLKMGASHPKNEIFGEGSESLKYLQDLFQLTEHDLLQLYQFYQKNDPAHSSSLSFISFCSLIHCEENPFLRNVFLYFSSASSWSSSLDNPSLTFCELILFVYFYLTLTEEDLSEYLYEMILYNHHCRETRSLSHNVSSSSPPSSRHHHRHAPPADKISPVDLHEQDSVANSSSSASTLLTIEQEIQELFGITTPAWGNERNIHHILTVLDHNLHGEVTLAQFKNGLHRNRSLLFPLVSYQMDMRSKVLSLAYWERRQGLASQYVPKIRRIKEELHRREAEDYRRSGGHSIELKDEMSKRDERGEDGDGGKDLMAIPVSNHTRHHPRPHSSYHPHHKDEDSPHEITSHEILPEIHSHQLHHSSSSASATSAVHAPPPLHVALPPPPHHQSDLKQSSPLPQILSPDSSAHHSLLYPLVAPPLGDEHPLTAHSPAADVGSSHIHSLHRLKLSHHTPSASLGDEAVAHLSASTPIASSSSQAKESAASRRHSFHKSSQSVTSTTGSETETPTYRLHHRLIDVSSQHDEDSDNKEYTMPPVKESSAVYPPISPDPKGHASHHK